MGKTESIKERRVDVYLDTLGRKERWTELAEEADESLSKFVQQRVEYAIEQGGPDFTELGERSKKIQDLEQEVTELRKEVNQIEIVRPFDVVVCARSNALDDGFLTIDDGLHVRLDRSSGLDAELFGSPREVSDFGATDHRFRRDAAAIQARPAEQILLNEGRLQAVSGTSNGDEEPGHAAAENVQVVARVHFNICLDVGTGIATTPSKWRYGPTVRPVTGLT